MPSPVPTQQLAVLKRAEGVECRGGLELRKKPPLYPPIIRSGSGLFDLLESLATS